MSHMLKLFFLPLVALSLFRAAGCRDAATDTAATLPASDCGEAIQIRNPLPRLTSDNFTVTEASADGNCLSVTLQATGCSAEAWTARLWAAERVPGEDVQTPAALLVFDDGVGEDEMTCQAIVEHTFQFDLTPYVETVPGATELDLTGTGTTVTLAP